MRSLSLFLLAALSFTVSNYSQFFWTEHVSGVSVSLNSVSNIDGNKAWICGNNSTVLRTVNSGYNWQNVGLNGIPSGLNLTHIFGKTDSAAFTTGISGSTAYLYRTTNFGANWQSVFTQLNGKINGVWFDGNYGYMIGDPVGGRWSIWRSSNNGANWDSAGMFLPQSGTEKGWSNSMWVYVNKIFFGTDNSRIYYSSNSGTNWVPLPTAPVVNSYNIWLDQFASSGIGAGDSLFRSVNSGLTWSPISGIGSGTYNCAIGVNGLNFFWYIRSSQNIYQGINASAWNIIYTAPSGIYNAMAPFRTGYYGGPGTIFAVRNNGGITRMNYIIEGVTIISNEIPSDYNLQQNYPNPFNASTIIKFDVPKLNSPVKEEVRGGFVKIIIYNSLGQQVSSLVNEVLQPGKYKAEWSGNELASGVYYYRLLVTDPLSSEMLFSLSKKMVLIK